MRKSEIVCSWDSDSGVEASEVVKQINSLQTQHGRGYLACFTEEGTSYIIFATGWISAFEAKFFVKNEHKKIFDEEDSEFDEPEGA